jgi:hypothetical protein
MRFRREFAEEMEAVFAEAVGAAVQPGRSAVLRLLLREMRDLPGSLIREYRSAIAETAGDLGAEGLSFWVRKDELPDHPDRPSSWGQTTVALALYVVPVIWAVLGFVLSPWLNQHVSETAVKVIAPIWALILVGSFLAVLFAGWVKGFPRWAFPYWGFALVFSKIMVNAATPGLPFFAGNELWGWRAWVPTMTVAVLAMLLTRVVRPLRQLVTGAWLDWTRLSFGFYGCVIWFLLVAFDETHGLGPVMLALMLPLALGALAYMRSRQIWARLISLLAGALLCWTAASLVLAHYWDGRQLFWMSEPGSWAETMSSMVVMGTFLVILLLSPILLGLLRLVVGAVHAWRTAV